MRGARKCGGAVPWALGLYVSRVWWSSREKMAHAAGEVDICLDSTVTELFGLGLDA